MKKNFGIITIIAIAFIAFVAVPASACGGNGIGKCWEKKQQAQIEENAAGVAENAAGVADLTEKYVTVNGDVINLDNKVDAVDTKHTAWNTEQDATLENHEGRITHNTEVNEQQEQHLTEIDADLAGVHDNINDLYGVVGRLSERMDKLEDRVSGIGALAMIDTALDEGGKWKIGGGVFTGGGSAIKGSASVDLPWGCMLTGSAAVTNTGDSGASVVVGGHF